MSWIIILLIYSIIVFFFSYWIYKNNYVFYKPFEYIDPETKEKINVHSLYPEFACLDKISFLKIFIGNFLFGLLKFLIDIFLAMMQIIRLKQLKKKLKDPTSNPEEWKILSHTISFWTKWLLRVNGIKVIKKEAQYEKVYKKYLGDDYSFDPNEKYSLLISNHLGFYDIVLNMALNSAGFLAKFEVKDYLLVGTIAQGINCLFVKRESEEDRMRTFAQLEQRQKDFYEGRSLTPLLLFPEGTTTNGKYILKFKRGAFYHLLPIKPQFVLLDDNLDYSVAIGVAGVGFNYFRSLSYCGCNLYFYELPVIKPTEYMWENFSHLGKEKWEIYAEVTRKIMCEISGLKPSNKNFRDSKYYEDSLRKGFYVKESHGLLYSKNS
jgi:lysophosphatidylcholine acyltransferase/lyso-PAF acetyltransferase